LALEDTPAPVEANPEGDYSVPPGQVLAHLQKWLTAKYAIDAAYRSFADRVRGPWRDALVDHWYEHSKEERQHAYDIAMRIVGMGGDPMQTAIAVPACTASLEGFFRTLATMELEAISVGRAAIKMAGENTNLQVMAENFVLVDSQHLDDLRRMQVQFDIPV
jgi:bacterioferritin (cytochrome b1)